MKIALLALGAIFFIFGLIDFIGSYADFDLWGIIGAQLPKVLWQYSAFFEMGVGAILFGAGKGYTAEEK